jgi:integrase
MAAIRKRRTASGEIRWDVRYWDPEKKQRSRAFRRRIDAQKFANVVETDIVRGEWLDPDLGKETFGQWARRWQLTILDRAPKTIERYESILRRHLLPRFENTPVSRITHPTVLALLVELQSTGASVATVRYVRAVLRLVLELARRSEAIRVNPVDGAKIPMPPSAEVTFLTAEQISTLAWEVANPPITKGGGEHRQATYPDYGLLVRFAGFSGLRAGEIVALRSGAVDLMRGRVHVLNSASEVHGKIHFGPPKTKQRRSVPLPKSLVGELTVHLAGKEETDFVFSSPRGGVLRYSNFYARRFKPAVLRAGLPQPTRFHDLRHSCAALLIAEGAHPKAIMEWLGHSSIQVTLGTYGHLFPNLEASLVDALDDVYQGAVPIRPADVRSIER